MAVRVSVQYVKCGASFFGSSILYLHYTILTPSVKWFISLCKQAKNTTKRMMTISSIMKDLKFDFFSLSIVCSIADIICHDCDCHGVKFIWERPAVHDVVGNRCREKYERENCSDRSAWQKEWLRGGWVFDFYFAHMFVDLFVDYS